jgi:hypothetical protein
MSSSVSSIPTSTHTLGAELERDRLERRVRRMTVAIRVLRHRESENRREPATEQAVANDAATSDADSDRAIAGRRSSIAATLVRHGFIAVDRATPDNPPGNVAG